MKDGYAETRTKIENALDECGIGHDVAERYRDGMKEVSAFAAGFVEKAAGQLAHNLFVNKPQGIDIDDTPGRHAVLVAAVSMLSKHAQWDIFAARKIAAEVLQDVNDHDTAKMLFELARESEAVHD